MECAQRVTGKQVDLIRQLGKDALSENRMQNYEVKILN